MADSVQAAGATLTVQCPDGLQAQAAPGVLARVLDNLLGNALRYAPGPVEVTAQRVPGARSPGAPALRISVLDRGPGIPAEQLQAVWQPFARAGGFPQCANRGLWPGPGHRAPVGTGPRLGCGPRHARRAWRCGWTCLSTCRSNPQDDCHPLQPMALAPLSNT